MYNERFTPIYAGEDVHLKPGRSHVFTFDGAGLQDGDRLFMTGENGLFYQWRDEPDYPHLYRHIDDSLNSREAERNQYCLDFTAHDFDFPKVAYRKNMWPPVLSYLGLEDYTDNWKLGLSVKAEDLTVHEGGYLRFVMEVRYRKPGRSPMPTYAEPDVTVTMEVPQGTYGWQRMERDVSFDASRVANVCFVLEGLHYSGKVYFENPVMVSDDGHNILPDFAPFAGQKPQFNWIGQNLSKKERPEFEITLNGQLIHRGELFERCHRYPENEIRLERGALLPGENKLEIRLISDYREAMCYNVHQLGIVSHSDSFLVSCPEIIHAGRLFAVLVRTEQEHTPLSWSMAGKSGETVLEEKGLHALRFTAPEPAVNVPLTLRCGGREEVCTISRCLIHEEDGVSTGTSDLIYIHQDDMSFEDYLSWYFSSHVGNLLTIRQSYRWNGTQALNDPLWYKTARLLNEAGMVYAHMLDCRELPGCNANPTLKSLEGPGFLGRQHHERDGAQCYWGAREIKDYNEEMYTDMIGRMHRQYPQSMGQDQKQEDQFYKNGGHYPFRDPDRPADMEAAAKFVVSQLSKVRGDAIRHTGPSALFKYFYQAGYKWTGAELMYGPLELVASALRGAADLYGGPTGSHLAVQWSSSPHDTEERFRRYRLALYSCYLQGIDEINTEEGLWHLEEYYSDHHRFSHACQGHTRQQQDFYRYVSSHSRTGKFYTPVGFLSGRYDGWPVFGRGNIWGNMPFSDAEKGWDILKFFYPRSKLNALYIHGCKNKPQGFYTGTPQGEVDIIPIEGPDYSRYRLLVAPGYNKALPEDMDKLQAYVNQGGSLIIGWPQLSVTTNRQEMVTYRHWYLDHPFVQAIAGQPAFFEDSYQGKPVTVSGECPDYPVVLTTDGGHPLVYQVPMGQGCVYFVNAKEYAGSDAVQAVYEALLEKTVPVCLAQEETYARGETDVQFAVYDQGNGQKHIYFLATDWFNDPEPIRHGKVLLQGVPYTVDVPFGQMVKAVATETGAVWPVDDRNEVLSLEKGRARVQGLGKAEFVIAGGGQTRTVTVDFTENPVQEIEL